MAMALVFHIYSALLFRIMWLDAYLLVVLSDSSYISCAVVISVYGVGSSLWSFLFKISYI